MSNRIQFIDSDENDERLFDFARPCVFRDYAEPKAPMKARSVDRTLQFKLRIGDYVCKRPDGNFVIERGDIRG